MKHTCPLLFLVWIACFLTACSEKAGWSLQGKIDSPQFYSVLLLGENGSVLDSTLISEGTFSLELPDNQKKPQIAIVRLLGNTNADEVYDMPVGIENGEVRLNLGEYIHISGTPLNDAMQEFLNGLQDCSDNCLAQEGLDEEAITRSFSEFYMQQITLNRQNALGAYIFRAYGVHLSKGDQLKAKELLNIK